MVRVRRRVVDPKVNRLIVAFLRAGVLSEEQFARSPAGTPQGGILSPLLANIALSVIEERYERHVWPRCTPTLRTEADEIERRARQARDTDRRRGRMVWYPVRYADDFIILVSAPVGPSQGVRAREAAMEEKAALASLLKERLNLELSEAKTLVTPVTERMRFLGHHVKVRPHPDHGRMGSTAVIPKDRSQRLRELVKRLFGRSTCRRSLSERLQKLNPLLRGWCYFYRHAWGASRVFSGLDNYVWWTIFRWLRKKHRDLGVKELIRRYAWRKPAQRCLRWRDGGIDVFRPAYTHVEHFKLGWQRPPDFAIASMESPVHNERCTPGSGMGRPETT